MFACLRIVVLLALGALLPAPGGFQVATDSARSPTERLRERWRDRRPEDRQRLERHLEEFARLEKEERHRLLERARALREREQKVEEEMSAELRAKLAELAPELRRAELRDHFRAHGRELRARLPAALRERLQSASPEARRRYVERLFEARERNSRRLLEKLCEQLDLPPGELQGIERLPPPQRQRALRELGHRIDRLRREPLDDRIDDRRSSTSRPQDRR